MGHRRGKKPCPAWMSQGIHKGSPLSFSVFTAILQGRYFKWHLALSGRVEVGTGGKRRYRETGLETLVGTKLRMVSQATEGMWTLLASLEKSTRSFP